MQEAMDMVQEFHEQVVHRPEQQSIEEFKRNVKITAVGLKLMTIAEELQEKVDQDPRWLRAHLMIEELGELVVAMGECNELGCLDSLADLLYVVVGSACTMDLPLPAAFSEVHRSNMTKERQPDDKYGGRVRQKGPNYSPPDLKTVLEKHRATMRSL